jgi:cell division septation protein DedD
MHDEGLHEIQLNGKQLVFLFMSATVVAVVIFLCGVMVGRGVAAQRALPVADIAEQAGLDPTAGAQSTTPEVSTGNESLTANEKLTYSTRLEAPSPPREALKPEAEADSAPAVPLAAALPPVREPAAAAPTPKPARPPDPAFKEPAGQGFVVQVAAVRKRAEAETIARRLNTKGYPTFVTTAGSNFRVRVGKYNDRRAAESIAARLEREERFKPWITR